jgi:hypothetical protein
MEDYRLYAKLLRQLTEFHFSTTYLPPGETGVGSLPDRLPTPLPVQKPVLSPLIEKRSSPFSIQRLYPDEDLPAEERIRMIPMPLQYLAW